MLNSMKKQKKQQKNEENRETEEIALDRRDKLNILFLGDTMMTGNVAAAMDQRGMDYPLHEFT